MRLILLVVRWIAWMQSLYHVVVAALELVRKSGVAQVVAMKLKA